jgi:hypothetical protein
MREAGAPSTGRVVPELSELCAPHRGNHLRTTEAFTLLMSIGISLENTKRSASHRTGVLHLEHSEEALSFARIATTLLQERLPWVTIVLYPTASERGECMLAMLFWVLAALAVVGALAIVWGLYLLARRWL